MAPEMTEDPDRRKRILSSMVTILVLAVLMGISFGLAAYLFVSQIVELVPITEPW